MLSTNPLLHRPGAGSMNPSEANSAAGGTYTDHIPQVQAGVLIGAALLLIAFKRAGFEVGLRVSAGR